MEGTDVGQRKELFIVQLGSAQSLDWVRTSEL